jgi:hypothetical protein
VTEYLLASQELEPGHGWDYSSLSVLVDRPNTDGAGLGRALIEGFDAYARNNGTAQDITLSLIDTAAMPALDEAMGAFAGLLTEQVDFLAPVAGRQRAQTLEFGRSENPEESTQLADLGVFVAELGVQSLQVSDEADAVLRALNDAVIERTAGPARLGATGLSIYFPTERGPLRQRISGRTDRCCGSVGPLPLRLSRCWSCHSRRTTGRIRRWR